jgi:hypothetical protein
MIVSFRASAGGIIPPPCDGSNSPFKGAPARGRRLSLHRFLPHAAHRKLHVVERFTISQDGKALTAIVTVEDPDTFNGPLTLKQTWRKNPIAMGRWFAWLIASGRLPIATTPVRVREIRSSPAQ